MDRGDVTDTVIDGALYTQALSRGVDDRRPRVLSEHASRPVEVLATAIELTPSLTLIAPLIVGDEGDARDVEHREALKIGRAISAGLVRVAHWAREVHARDVGYQTYVWIEQAILSADHLANDQRTDPAVLLDQLEEASAHLADAVVALQCDRFAVPDAITQAQAAWLTAYTRTQRALTA